MKKILPIIAIAAVIVVVYITAQNSSSNITTSNTNQIKSEETSPANKQSPNNNEEKYNDYDDSEQFEEEIEIKPVTESYKNIDEALAAIYKGAEEYDDYILEQFAEVGEECIWCNELFAKLQNEILSPDISEDQRSYYAEILATSGRPENLQALIDAVNNAANAEEASIFSEALTVAIGNDKTVEFLNSKLENTQGELREAIITAITNHGSPLAVEALYQETIKSGDASGYYDLGIGLGEVIPNEDSLPYLTELANKHDQYSHLAVKALLNYGTDGLRLVIDILNNSNSSLESKRAILTDAIDHVSYEDESKTIAEEALKNSKDPVITEFAKEIIESFAEDDEDEDDNEDDEEDVLIEE